jgi:biopolymer transport protein ExbB
MTYTEIYSPVLYPMWLMSFILVALVIDRMYYLRKRSIFDRNMIRDVQMHAAHLEFDKALERAQSSESLLGKAWSKGLREFMSGGANLADALSESTYLMMSPLKKNITAIGTVASIAPLFGLLGTLIGLIIIFSQLGGAGADEKKQLAVGIGHALYSTIGGLSVAIPGIIFYRFFKSRLTRYSESAEFEIDMIKHNYMISKNIKAAAAGRE